MARLTLTGILHADITFAGSDHGDCIVSRSEIVELKELKRHWDTFGQEDPLWAILIRPDKQHGRWDLGEFFAIGKQEINRVLNVVRTLDYRPKWGAALDFGCGVGRLTQALGDYFAECHGVDIAPSMIEKACEYNRHGEQCSYHVNDKSDLSLFKSNKFDFIYTNIVLQHMRQVYSHGYIREFVRTLSPGGMLVFQIPGRKIDLSQLAFRAAIVGPASLRARSSECVKVTCQVTNISEFTWPAVNLGNHWRSALGVMLQNDDGRMSVPTGMEPGETQTVGLTVTAPSQPGEYLLELDMVQEGVTWFNLRGSATAKVPCTVLPPRTMVVRKLAGVVMRTRDLLPPKWRRESAVGKMTAMVMRLSRSFRPVHISPVPAPPDAEPACASNTNQKKSFQPVMEMYGTPKEDILTLLHECGARVLHVERDHAAGHELESWRYYVTK